MYVKRSCSTESSGKPKTTTLEKAPEVNHPLPFHHPMSQRKQMQMTTEPAPEISSLLDYTEPCCVSYWETDLTLLCIFFF